MRCTTCGQWKQPNEGQGVNAMNNSGFIIDTPEGIEAYYMLARYKALKLEIKTGMSYSKGSVMNFLKEKHGFKGGTKRVILRQYGDYLIERGIMTEEGR